MMEEPEEEDEDTEVDEHELAASADTVGSADAPKKKKVSEWHHVYETPLRSCRASCIWVARAAVGRGIAVP